MERPLDIKVEKEIIQNCLAYYWRCRCCIKLGWSKLAFYKCEHYGECKEFVYSKLKKHFRRVIERESNEK